MSNYINRIYELNNLSILTPVTLVSNIKLDNYHEVKYYKQKNALICEMISIENEEEIRYMYEFDEEDKLQKATILYGIEKMKIFNRNNELKLLLSEHENKKVRKLG